MISNLLHLVGLRPRVYYTLTNFRGGGQGPLAPPLNTTMLLWCLKNLNLRAVLSISIKTNPDKLLRDEALSSEYS